MPCAGLGFVLVEQRSVSGEPWRVGCCELIWNSCCLNRCWLNTCQFSHESSGVWSHLDLRRGAPCALYSAIISLKRSLTHNAVRHSSLLVSLRNCTGYACAKFSRQCLCGIFDRLSLCNHVRQCCSCACFFVLFHVWTCSQGRPDRGHEQVEGVQEYTSIIHVSSKS